MQRKAVFDWIFPLSISGFSVSTAGRMHIFKPVSVQAMWYVRGWAQGETLLLVSKLKIKNQLRFSLHHSGYLVQSSSVSFSMGEVAPGR